MGYHFKITLQNKIINMKDYHWICGSSAGNLRAKDMKDACKKAIWAQMPDKYDKEKIYFHKMKVVKGKLPEYW
jgi:hypothetical protein